MENLISGVAGFIGFHACQRLLNTGYEIVGVDNMNNYYHLKQNHLNLLQSPLFSFHKIELVDLERVAKLFETKKIKRVIHLAAQVGVR